MKKAIHKKSRKRVTPKKKKLPKRKAAPKNAGINKQTAGKKTISLEAAASFTQEVREKSRSVEMAALAADELGTVGQPGELSGDLQGLSRIEDADSESVAELLEEGNAFEASVVEGVEDAPNADKGPVRTHEVPADDLPDEEIPDEYKHKE